MKIRLVLAFLIVGGFIFLLPRENVFAQCSTYPCIDPIYHNTSCTDLTIDPNVVTGPPLSVDQTTDYTSSLRFSVSIKDNGRYCIKTEDYKGACLLVEETSADHVLSGDIGFSALGHRALRGMQGIHPVYIHTIDQTQIPYCVFYYNVIDKLLAPTPTYTPTPTRTPTPIPQSNWFDVCNLAASPIQIEDIDIVSKSTRITGRISRFGNNPAFESERFWQIVVTPLTGYAKLYEGNFIESSERNMWYLNFSQVISFSDRYYVRNSYRVDLNVKTGAFGSWIKTKCSTSFQIGENLPSSTPTPTPTPTLTSEEQKNKETLENLKKICSPLKENKAECEACVGGEKFDGNPGAYTALGCMPTDLSQFLHDYLFSIGLGFAGGIAFLLMLWGGFTIIISQGDPQKIQQGREIIVSAAVGLLFIIFAVVILKIIGQDILKLPFVKST